jgi:hypothetical protein
MTHSSGNVCSSIVASTEICRTYCGGNANYLCYEPTWDHRKMCLRIFRNCTQSV